MTFKGVKRVNSVKSYLHGEAKSDQYWITHLPFTCSKTKIKTVEKAVKYDQS